MNTTKKAFLLITLLFALPNFIHTEENPANISKKENNYSITVKDQKSLFFGTLGLLSGYIGLGMIKNSLEAPIIAYNRQYHGQIPQIYQIANFPELFTGTALLYIGYKLIANKVKQENIIQE